MQSKLLVNLIVLPAAPTARRMHGGDLKRELPNDSMDFYGGDSDSDQGGGSECGVIEKVQLENFRVHEVLNLDLNPNINFIVGDNGSGKSSILSAIQIALGSKGKSTGQGTKFANFVKYGAKTAKIVLHIRNVGPDAYCPNVYGPTIVIERKVGAVNSFEVKNSQFQKVKIVGTARDEVTRIVDQFNIQVENPIMIMTQELQKKFITATPGDLFAFFHDATQMRSMEEDFRVVKGDIENIDESIKKSEEVDLPKAEEQFRKAEAEYRAVEYLQEDERKIKQAKCMYAWKLLEEKEVEYEQTRQQVQALENRTQKVEDTVAEHQSEIACLKEHLEEKTNKYNEAEAIATADLELVEAASEEVKTLDRKFRDKQKKVKQVDRDSAKAKKERKKLEAAIAELHGRGDSSTELEPLMMEKNQLEDSIVSAKQEADAAKHENFQVAKRVSYIDEGLQRAVEDEQERKHQLQEMDLELARLKGSLKNQVLKFLSGDENQALALMNAIAKESRFQRTPVGPIGKHVQLRDPSWAIAIQNGIGLQFKSFVCDNFEDKRLLTGLLNKHGNSRTRIVVSKFGPRHKTVRPASENQVTTIEDQLIVDNDVAFNVLVDFTKMESIVLCESRDEAQKLVKTNKKITQVFLKKDGQSVKYSFGSLSFSPPQTHQCTLGQNSEAAIATLERERQEQLDKSRDAAEAVQEQKNERIELRAQHKEMMRTSADVRRKYEGMEYRMRQIQGRMSEIRNEMEEDTEMAGKVAAITDEINEIEQQTRDLEQQREQCVNDSREVEEERDSAIRRKEQLYQRAVKKMEEEGVEVLGEEIETIRSHIRQRADYLRTLANTRNNAERDLDAKRREVQEQEEAVEKARLQAPKYAEKLDLDEFLTRPANLSSQKNSQDLWKSITRLSERIKERQGNVDVRAIEANFRLKKSSLEDIQRRRNKQRAQLENFKTDLKKRLKAQKKFRKETEKLLKHKFKSYMNKRNHRGTLSIDYENKTLSFDVTVSGNGSAGVDQSSESAAKKQKKITDTKTLSGGERAFTTVAFLLALGEAMDCPVRAMDEFDCFMDAANRNVSIRELIEFAKMQNNRQFLFLTPLSMTQSIYELQSDPMVKIPKDQSK